MNLDEADLDEDSPLKNAFSKGLRDVAYDLVKISYNQVVQNGGFDDGWGEDDYTKQIYRFMKKCLPQVNDHISISLEDPVTSERTLAVDFPTNKMGRVDLTVERVGKAENIHFWIECKLLKVDDHRLLREYIKEGVQRYVSGKYAEEDSDRESMAGYVLKGEISEVAERLSDKLDYYEAKYDEMVNLEENIWLDADEGDVARYRSRHYRAENDLFQLDHFFLDFRLGEV